MRRDRDIGGLTRRGQVYMAIIGVAVLCPGLAALLLGGNSYLDLRGLVAFAPAMVLIGALFVVIAVVRGPERKAR